MITEVQRKLKRHRQEFEAVGYDNTSYFCWITPYSDSHYLLRSGMGIVKWFMSEDYALQWWTDYLSDNGLL